MLLALLLALDVCPAPVFKRDCLAPLSRAAVPAFSFYSRFALEPAEVEPIRSKIGSQPAFALLLESLKLPSSGFEIVSETKKEIHVRSVAPFQDRHRVSVEFDLENCKVRIATQYSMSREEETPSVSFSSELVSKKAAPPFFAKMSPDGKSCAFHFEDGILTLRNGLRTFFAVTAPAHPLLLAFRKQMFIAGRRELISDSNRFSFAGNAKGKYRFLVVESREGNLLGIFYYDKSEKSFYELRLDPKALWPPVGNIECCTTDDQDWLLVEARLDTRQIFFRNFPVPAPEEKKLFKDSGLSKKFSFSFLDEEPSEGEGNRYSPSFDESPFGLHVLYYPPLDLQIACGGNSENLKTADLVSLRMLEDRDCLEAVAYATRLVKDVERLFRKTNPTLSMHYFRDSSRTWQYRDMPFDNFVETVSDLNAKLAAPIASSGVKECDEFWLLGDWRRIEYAVYLKDGHWIVLNSEGKRVGTFPAGVYFEIARRNADWAFDLGSWEWRFESGKLRGEQFGPSDIPGLTRREWQSHFERLAKNPPLWEHASESGRTVVWEHRNHFEVFGMENADVIRYRAAFPKSEKVRLRFDPSTKTLNIEDDRPESKGSYALSEGGFFRNVLFDGNRILRILRRIAELMSSDEMEGRTIPLVDRIARSLRNGTAPETIVFRGKNQCHLPGAEDEVALWGEVRVVEISARKQTTYLDHRGSMMSPRQAALFDASP